jgi:hypothetical protein
MFRPVRLAYLHLRFINRPELQPVLSDNVVTERWIRTRAYFTNAFQQVPGDQFFDEAGEPVPALECVERSESNDHF